MSWRHRCGILLFSILLGATPAMSTAQPTNATAAGIKAYNRGDVRQAFRLLSAAAVAGDADAQVNLGYMYARGHGTPADQVEAMRLYRLSAAQGNAEGMNAIGYKYHHGSGVPPDIDQAVHWYCMAAVRGNPRALNNLATLYEVGHGVPRDIAEARNLWSQAAERGHLNAMYNLGLSFARGPGTIDNVEALRWMRRAAEAGHAGAQAALRQIGDRSRMPPAVDPGLAMRLIPSPADPGRARACGELIS